MRWLAFFGCLIFGEIWFSQVLPAQSQPANIADDVFAVREKRYEKAIALYRQGSIKEASIALDQCLQMLLPSAEGLGVNSVAIHAMLGECFYLSGNLEAALFQFDNAIDSASRSGAWFQQKPWEGSAQQVVFHSVDGNVSKGAFSNAVTFDGSEIWRCLATAVFRRRVILESLASPSDSVKRLGELWSMPQDDFGESFIGSMNACIAFGQAKDDGNLEACEKHARSGDRIHVLSPLVYLIAARQQVRQGNLSSAIESCEQSIIASEAMGQPEWIAEAWMLIAACAEGESTEGLIERCRSCCAGHLGEHRLTSIGSLIAAAELSLSRNDPANALKYATQAKNLLSRQDVSIPRYQASIDLMMARIRAAGGGKFGAADVDDAVGRVMKFAHYDGDSKLPASPLLFQWNRLTAVRWSPSGRKKDVDPKEKWFRNIHDKIHQASVWRLDHVNALHWIVLGHGPSSVQVAEQQFRMKVESAQPHEVLPEIDTLLRTRYWSQRMHGGRIEQMLSCAKQGQFPEPTIGLDGVLQKMHEVWKHPIDINGPEAQVQADVIASAVTVLALSRQPIVESVLSKLETDGIPSLLQDDEALIAFVSAGKFIHGTLTYRGQTKSWKVSLQKVDDEVTELLKNLGVVKHTGPPDPARQWQQTAFQLRNLLFPDSTLAGLQDVQRFVIVPDNVLWYLPFDVLPLLERGGKIWQDQIEISYAGTPGLALSRKNESEEKSDGKIQSMLMIQEPSSGNDPRLQQWLHLNRTAGPLVLPRFQTQSQSPILDDGLDLSSLVIEMQIAKVPAMIVGRWPVEGEATEVLMQEFTQELPHEGAMAAWRRSLQVLHRSPIEVANASDSPQAIRGNHPIFWAGYLFAQSPP